MATPTPEVTPGGTPTPLPTPTQTATATPSPTPVESPECVADVAGDPVREALRVVEADGEPGDDLLWVYGIGDSSAPSEWRIRVEAGDGQAYDSELIVDPPGNAVLPIGGADIDGDGRDEMFTVVGTGAYATIVALHAIVGCDLVPLSNAGMEVRAAVGASAGNVAGLTCTEEYTLILWDGVADPDGGDGAYDVTGREYSLEGAQLTEIDRIELGAKLGEPEFVYGDLSCHGLTPAGRG